MYMFSLGGLAQLARALAWHARGRRFESVILHESRQPLWGVALSIIDTLAQARLQDY